MYDVSYREGRQLAEIAAKPEEKARLIKQLIEKKVSEGTMQVAAPPPPPCSVHSTCTDSPLWPTVYVMLSTCLQYSTWRARLISSRARSILDGQRVTTHTEACM
jgi:hypothetical protein